MAVNKKRLKFGVFIIAYNAAETIVEVYQRIPDEVKDAAEEIFVFDDCSQDSTYEKILEYKKKLNLKKLQVYRNRKNLGYGGNQKRGYQYAIKKGFDVVVMLHGDAQYAPEKTGDLVDSFEDAPQTLGMVFGSRMTGSPLKGGMPIYKFTANKVLTGVENFMLGSDLSEFHSGFRGYSCKALSRIPFDLCSDGFSFDTEIIIMLLQRGFQIGEVTVPTYYGSEKCRVPLFKYGIGCLKAVVEYKLSQLGLAEFERYTLSDVEERKKIYQSKASLFSSHSKINHYLEKLLSTRKKRTRVLDLACGTCPLVYPETMEVDLVGIDIEPVCKSEYYSEVIKADIEDYSAIAELSLGKFDVIVMGDILEHLVNSEEALIFYSSFLSRNGRIIISVPNVANIYVRLSLLLGLFNYSNKGILDRTHLRFFTLSSIKRLVQKAGLEVKDITFTPIPFELIIPGLLNMRGARLLLPLSNRVTGLWRKLLAYQFILVAGKK